MTADRERAFNDACRLVKTWGSSPYRDWQFTLRLADWLLGDQVAPTEPTQEEVLEDDLLRCMEVRNLALEEAALYVQPGPDGQDYLDRGRLIRMWVDAAHERYDDGERAADAHIGGFRPSPSLAQWAAAPQVTPEPQRCPTCKGTNREAGLVPDVLTEGAKGRLYFSTRACRDQWHRPAPLVEGEQTP